MMKNIWFMTIHDLAMAYKNKTVFLILFIPVFVFLSLELLDRESSTIKKINIGLVENEKYNPLIIKSLTSADLLFTVINVLDGEDGVKYLKKKKIDGLLLRSEKDDKSLELVVLEKGSLSTLSIVEGFSVLQRAAEGKSISWISDIKPLQQGGIQKQTLPTWVLMLVLLVGFIIMPAQVAEEKEKKLLLGLLQTPMREIEWLIAKLLSGMILIFIAVLLLHLLGRFEPVNFLGYTGFIVVGSFCFSSYGILLGLLCRNQASARTLGVLFYLPHLLPSALSDFSYEITSFAPFLPSYQLYEPIKSILLNEGIIYNLSFEWLYLLLVGLIASSLSFFLIKKRWLME